MGNVFEGECKQLMQQNSHKLNPPLYLSQLIEKHFRTPFCVYRVVKAIVESFLTFSYLLKKKPFLKMAE